MATRATRAATRRTIGEQLGFTDAQARALIRAGLLLQAHEEPEAAADVLAAAARVLELTPLPTSDAADTLDADADPIDGEAAMLTWLHQELEAPDVEVPLAPWQGGDGGREPWRMGWRDD